MRNKDEITKNLLDEIHFVAAHATKKMGLINEYWNEDTILAAYKDLAYTIRYNFYNDYYPQLKLLDDLLNALMDIYKDNGDKQINAFKKAGNFDKTKKAYENLIYDLYDVYTRYEKAYKKSLKTK